MADYLRESGVKWLWEKIKTLLSAKQDTLVSGTNIKTINGTSLLGSGDVSISGGSGGDFNESGAYPNLTAGKATKLATARTISLSGGASGSVDFDGSANKTLNVTDLKESLMSYGGADLFGSITPIDGAAMGELWCNKLAYYNTDYIQVEYTNNYSEDEDGNESSDVVWTEYPFVSDSSRKSNLTMLVTDYADTRLYSSGSADNNTAIAGKTRLRVTLLPYTSRYLVCQKLIVKIGASIPQLNNQLKIEYVSRTDYDSGNVDKFTHLKSVKISGDSGFSSIDLGGRTFGIATYAERRKMRFTLIVNNVDATARPPVLHHIYILGTHHTANDSRIASHGVPYSYDEEQRTKWYKPLYPDANGATDLGMATKYWNNVYGKKFITSGGTNQQVVLGNGTLKALSEISPITDADAEILLDNHIHSINVSANGNDVNISVIKSSKNGDTWETEDNDITIPLATPTSAGLMSKEDKAKLDGGNVAIEPDSGMPDLIGDYYDDVDMVAEISLRQYYQPLTEGCLYLINAIEGGSQCIIMFIYRSDGCIPISTTNTNTMKASISGTTLKITGTDGSGELRIKQIKLI